MAINPLEDGTVHLSAPDAFNDPFDCLVSIDVEKATATFLKEFAKRLNVNLCDSQDSHDIASTIAEQLNGLREEGLPPVATLRVDGFTVTCQLFYLSLLLDARQRGGFDAEVIRAAVRKKVEEEEASIRGCCKVACFTSNAYNLHMWAHYANEHRGFCIEYDVPEMPQLVWNQLDEHQRYLLCNMFGVYYSPTRQDITDSFIKVMLGLADASVVNRLYANIFCSKGFEWAFEQEYRLIEPDSNTPSEVSFFPARTVFLGARMPENSRQEIVKMVAGKNTNVMQMQLSQERYGLDAKPIVTYGAYGASVS